MQTSSVQPTRDVPRIQTPPAVNNNNAIRYGYCAYNDISLLGPLGVEKEVQPGDSPFRTKLPAKTLIPFTTISVGIISPDQAASDEPGLPVNVEQKSAAHCVEEIVNAYQNFGFVYLEALTAIPEEDAFHVFQVIQPLSYKIKDLEYQLNVGAVERINDTETMTVTHDDFKFTIEPLPERLKPIAHRTRAQLAASAAQATKLATKIHAETVQKMTQYFSTGEGKMYADPRDKYIFDQIETEIPSLFAKDNKQTGEGGYLKAIAEGFNRLSGNVPQSAPDGTLERIAELEAKIEALSSIQTPQEVKEAVQAPNAAPKSFSVGDVVMYEGEKATVTAKPFGRYKLLLADGENITVDFDQLTATE